MKVIEIPIDETTPTLIENDYDLISPIIDLYEGHIN